MNSLSAYFEKSPALVRVAPFIVFIALTSMQDLGGESARYWVYLVKTLVGGGLIWLMRPVVAEMRWTCSVEAVVIGFVVFGLWVGLDAFYPKFGAPAADWNPHNAFGNNSLLAGMFVLVRMVGSALIVPPLEEVFYRSFIYRWIQRPDFMALGQGVFQLRALLVASLVFGVAHHEWLAGILCGVLYQALVCWTKRLGDAITAHAITNFLLGLWVVGKGAWHFW